MEKSQTFVSVKNIPVYLENCVDDFNNGNILTAWLTPLSPIDSISGLFN